MFDDKIAEIKTRWQDVPYRKHGRDIRGVDCIGILFGVYGDLGIDLPGKNILKNSGPNWIHILLTYARTYFKTIGYDEIEPFDFLLFIKQVDELHSGIALGNDEFIHCYGENGVQIDSIKRWRPQFHKAMRMRGGG